MQLNIHVASTQCVHTFDPTPHHPHLFTQRIQLSVDRMQRVVDLSRTIRERRNKPLKFPLKGLVVVHDDTAFLDDIQGGYDDDDKE